MTKTCMQEMTTFEGSETWNNDQENNQGRGINNAASGSLRVIIHAHKPDEETTDPGNLVQLPESVQELLDLAEKKLGKRGSVIVMEDGSQVEDLDALRDNDHLFIL
ncbi:hypothetical protein QVD17_04024 [Tagetes erecta]|uniref:KHA domain-containing protein n=1 Tax=Tagetes erecta TaxID=13708 RepID=A0AAD8LEP6_TARER|nr:hypothetical protein QVD17_04024 [Tagetes erecta]